MFTNFSITPTTIYQTQTPMSELVGKRVRESSTTEKDHHQDKKMKVLTPYEKFWSLLKHLMSSQFSSSPELQDFAQIVCITCDLKNDNEQVSIEKLNSTFSIEQIEEILSITEWAFLLERGCIPLDDYPKERYIEGNLKKYLGINFYIDILTHGITPQKEFNSLSLMVFCKMLEQQIASDKQPQSQSPFETIKCMLNDQCNKRLSVNEVLSTFVNDLKMDKMLVESFRSSIEKMPLEMRFRIVLLAKAILYTLSAIPTHESLTSIRNCCDSIALKELHPLIEQFEHCHLELRKEKHKQQFWSLMHFHLEVNYEKIVNEFSRVCKIDFQDFYGCIVAFNETFSKEEIKELHHIIEWRYLLLQGRTTSDIHTLDSVKEYLGIKHCIDVLTQDIEPKKHINSISLKLLCQMLAQAVSSNQNMNPFYKFSVRMKSYCLDRINALFTWNEVARTFSKDLEVAQSVLDSFKQNFEQMPFEMKLRTILLAKVVRYCQHNPHEELTQVPNEYPPSIPENLIPIVKQIDLCLANKKKGLYLAKSNIPSWNYPSSSTGASFSLSSLLPYMQYDMSNPHFSKVNLQGMPNWMPNGGNSCYISSTLWPIYFLLDKEMHAKIQSVESERETELQIDKKISLAKKALIDLYRDLSSPEEKKIPSSTINSFRKFIHDAYPRAFFLPQKQEQEDAFDFLICILKDLQSLDPFLAGAPEFQRRHSYPNSTNQPLIEAEHYDWKSALSSFYSKEALHAIVDISLDEQAQGPQTLDQLVTVERQTEDVGKNAYKINNQHDGPHHQTITVQHFEQIVVESEQTAPHYFIGRLARFSTDAGGRNHNKRSDVVIPNATLEFNIKDRESAGAVSVPYDLVAITNHKGKMINGGHFYCYYRKFVDDQWRFYKYDDLAQPSVCEDNEKVIEDVASNGYIFYYKKRDAQGVAPTPVPFQDDPARIYELKMTDAEKWIKSQNLSSIFAVHSEGKVFKTLMDLFATNFPESKELIKMIDNENEVNQFIESSSLVVGIPIYFIDPEKDKGLQVVNDNIQPSEPFCFGKDLDKSIVYVFRQKDESYVLLEKIPMNVTSENIVYLDYSA